MRSSHCPSLFYLISACYQGRLTTSACFIRPVSVTGHNARTSPRQCDVMIIAGTLVNKMAPALRKFTTKCRNREM